MWSFDLSTLPQLPCKLDPLPLPPLPEGHAVLLDMTLTPEHRGVWAGEYTNYDISCLAQMSARSSVALDARAAYMLDWDKGFPGGASVEYEQLFNGELESGTWPWPTRPAFGHVKIWTHRPHAAVLWTPHSRCLGAIMGNGVCGCGRRHGDEWGWGSDGEDDEDEEEEEEQETDWQNALWGLGYMFDPEDEDEGLDGLVQLFMEETDDGPDGLDGVVDVLLELDLSEDELGVDSASEAGVYAASLD